MNAQTQLHNDIRAGLEAHAKLPLEDRLARLRDIGILTADFQLSERYGGKPAKAKKEKKAPSARTTTRRGSE